MILSWQKKKDNRRLIYVINQLLNNPWPILTSMSSCVSVSGSSPIILARCRLPMLKSSTCFLINSSENFSGPAAARFFRRRQQLVHICLLTSWKEREQKKDLVLLWKMYFSPHFYVSSYYGKCMTLFYLITSDNQTFQISTYIFR